MRKKFACLHVTFFINCLIKHTIHTFMWASTPTDMRKQSFIHKYVTSHFRKMNTKDF